MDAPATPAPPPPADLPPPSNAATNAEADTDGAEEWEVARGGATRPEEEDDDDRSTEEAEDEDDTWRVVAVAVEHSVEVEGKQRASRARGRTSRHKARAEWGSLLASLSSTAADLRMK